MLSNHNRIKPETSYREIAGKPQNIWKLKTYSKVPPQILKYFEQMKIHRNLWDAAKVVHRRMFIALSALLENKI